MKITDKKKDKVKSMRKDKDKSQGKLGSQVIEPEIVNAEKPKKPLKMTANQIAIAAMRQQGLSQAETADQLGVSKSYVKLIDKKLDRKYDLTDTHMVKAAHKAVKNLLAGEPFGSIEKVKDSTALAAAQMVYDRAQPIIKSNDNNSLPSFINININLSEYGLKDIKANGSNDL